MFRKTALALATVAVLSGCYGPFELTQKLHKWNGGLGDKWVCAGVFLLLNIVPVYDVAVIADAIVLNSVQFWTGESMLESKVIEKDGMKTVMTGYPDQKVIRMEIFRDGKLVETAVLAPFEDGSMRAMTLDGKRIVSRQGDNGSIVVSSADGKILGTYGVAEVEARLR